MDTTPNRETAPDSVVAAPDAVTASAQPSGRLRWPTLPLRPVHRGKVREVFEVDDRTLLLVASDRVSAFDVVLPQPVPRKGEVLTLLTAWWAERIGDVTPHHVLAVDPDEILRSVPALAEADRGDWARRSMLVRRTTPLPVECVVRGYLAGSAWREYRDRKTLAGEPLAEGLVESGRLDAPIFSPATKARMGHDENIPFGRVVQELGAELATRLRDTSLTLYRRGAEVTRAHGILLADTKFEFGLTPDGRLLLIDEVLTPDSSRYWPLESYEPGRAQESLDKQPIRDWLDRVPGWDKTPPPPDLPASVVEGATRRYLELFERLTGTSLDRYRPPRFGVSS